jgi:hypothetical protein
VLSLGAFPDVFLLQYRESLTPAQLGKAIGVEQSDISEIERSERPIA